MLNGVDLNYAIVLLVTGSVLLAAIYHTILYSHRKTIVLSRYSAYLWASFVYCAFRSLFYSNTYDFSYWNPDEVLQMIAFMLYIRFAAEAWDLHPKKDKQAIRFTRMAPIIVLSYLAINTVFANTSSITLYVIAKIVIRVYLLLIGFLMVLIVIQKRQCAFYRYLAAGAISMIICGFVSSVFNLTARPGEYILNPLSWLMFGFFLDVVFFSAAIGYRIRQEHEERETSLKTIMQKEAELQQKELEKVKAIYETREEERLRIARDLHDDMGSTLSSISIYTRVVISYISNDHQKAEEFLEKIESNTRLLMEHTNDLIWSLQTNYGETESIFKRMQKAAIELLSSANINPHIHLEERDLPLLNISAQKNCWLLFKESINNVCKYSKAANCHIKMIATPDLFEIFIRDDGIGFNAPRSGNGLKNMMARAQALDGECVIESSVGNGTMVKASFPITTITSRPSFELA